MCRMDEVWRWTVRCFRCGERMVEKNFHVEWSCNRCGAVTKFNWLNGKGNLPRQDYATEVRP